MKPPLPAGRRLVGPGPHPPAAQACNRRPSVASRSHLLPPTAIDGPHVSIPRRDSRKLPAKRCPCLTKDARATVSVVGTGSGLSMQSRAEVTARFAKAYVKASKKEKGRVLDEVVAVTGWSRDNARRRLVAAAKRPPGRPSGRQGAEEGTLVEVLLRRGEGAAEGVGGLGRSVWEVPGGLDVDPAGRAGTPRRADLRRRPVQLAGARSCCR